MDVIGQDYPTPEFVVASRLTCRQYFYYRLRYFGDPEPIWSGGSGIEKLVPGFEFGSFGGPGFGNSLDW
jgi:hypothetical protein